MDATGDRGIPHHTADGRRGGPAVARVRAAATELKALLTGDGPGPEEADDVVDELAALVQLAALAGHASLGRRSSDVEAAAVRFTLALQSLRDDPGRDD
ncbi:hypothetical protein [Actinomycetospora lemnae]|uniref:Uncharacterized protein n=1 Tax=Actinomycetospora lemnae TaxID=3019891 RepID=A0ABT5SM69_9PSEU|nr:hypothetical protein [Actinomycetospora sp. DW7H6]MDD7963923.1 hypothetical protein [Actinomycetospora sp. DW7H6]